jgi:phenylalanyl-tRNA synthetase beta chain
MPQVNIVRDELFKAVGKTFTDEQFEDLCFEYGLEMEMGTGTEMNMTRLDAAGNNIDMSKTVVYKVEVPANSYDLLCLEGLALAIRYYLGLEKDARQYKVLKPAKFEKIIVKPETK